MVKIMAAAVHGPLDLNLNNFSDTAPAPFFDQFKDYL